jgi:hypothetical protein
MAKKPYEYNAQFEIPRTAITFDEEAFEAMVHSQGVQLVHYAAQPCPVGKIDIGDNRRPHDDHEGCSNGYIYTKMGTITCLFTNQSNTQSLRDLGFVDGASVVVTFPLGYDDNEREFAPAQFDRFYLKEESLVEPMWEYVRSNETGFEKLSFPAVRFLLPVVDWRGEKYVQDVDFTIDQKGQIAWGARRPAPDLDHDKGCVISVRYQYRPFWILARKLHDIRVSQKEDFMTTERKIIRMPVEAILNREFLYLNQANDSESLNPDTSRQGKGPEDGGFGPR